MNYKERFYKLRNFQSKDFWAMVFARPLTILFLFPIIEKKWITPNRVTVASVLVKLVGIYLIAFKMSWSAGLWGAFCINLGLIFDNMDGTIARYRGCGTYFGYFFDKATDAVTLVLLFWAMGWRAYLSTNDLWSLILPHIGIIGAFIANYSKWVSEVVFLNLNLKEMTSDKEKLFNWALAKTAPSRGSTPPERNLFDWIKWLASAFLSIFLFNEVDIYFWCALALITEKYWIFTHFNALFLGFGLIAGPILFCINIYKREKSLPKFKLEQ